MLPSTDDACTITRHGFATAPRTFLPVGPVPCCYQPSRTHAPRATHRAICAPRGIAFGPNFRNSSPLHPLPRAGGWPPSRFTAGYTPWCATVTPMGDLPPACTPPRCLHFVDAARPCLPLRYRTINDYGPIPGRLDRIAHEKTVPSRQHQVTALAPPGMSVAPAPRVTQVNARQANGWTGRSVAAKWAGGYTFLSAFLHSFGAYAAHRHPVSLVVGRIWNNQWVVREHTPPPRVIPHACLYPHALPSLYLPSTKQRGGIERTPRDVAFSSPPPFPCRCPLCTRPQRHHPGGPTPHLPAA